MRAPINIQENSEFFIALCTAKVHSYIILGVKNGPKIEVLASIGKSLNENSSLWGFYLWDTEAILQNEDLMFGRNHKKKKISYKAYAINYNNYVEFLNYLKIISMAQKDASALNAYCPDPDHPFTTPFTWRPFDTMGSSAPPPNSADISSYQRLGGINNNCRHSAFRLTQAATKRKDLGRGVSTRFFQPPPLQAIFSDGTLDYETPHFYILPLPPQSFSTLTNDTFKVINKLYRRLDKIVLSEQDNPVTHLKFDKIKALYNKITSDHEVSLLDLMKGINNWAIENNDLIATHRKSHWIPFQTATQKMFSQFHQQFEALQERSKLTESGLTIRLLKPWVFNQFGQWALRIVPVIAM